jgi:hypothetical protein
MFDDLPALDGTIDKTWPPNGYTGFVFTVDRKQPWAYLSGGQIFAYGASKKAAWANSMPKHAAVRG